MNSLPLDPQKLNHVDRIVVVQELVRFGNEKWEAAHSLREEGNKIVSLGKMYRSLQNLSEAIKELQKVVDSEWSTIEADLQEAMIEEGCKSINVNGLGMFTMRARNMLSVNAANKSTLFFPYLTESNNADILKLDVNPKTLGAFLDSHFAELQSKYEAEGMDNIQARDKALEFLKEKGVTYFVKRDIAFKKGE